MKYKKLGFEEKWIVKGIPLLFIIGTVMHFLYDLTNKNIFIGLFSAINESVWEHTKMVLMPIIFWWSIYYILRVKKYNIDKNRWFTGSLVALCISIISVIGLYYFYTGAFGIKLVSVDIAILFIALCFAQFLGLHVYKYCKGINTNIVILIFIVIIVLYVIFTFYPPLIPVFKDGISGRYGLMR